MYLVIVAVLLFASTSDATTGMDISSYGCTGINYGCLTSAGYKFAIIESKFRSKLL
jgi:hypothetical protein